MPMHCIDVFNGDADGICALQQLRLHRPQPEARLITGVKRDIALLARLAGTTNSRITVLDLSLNRNRAALEQLLALGNTVFYADHHFSGEIPQSPLLEVHIDPSPQVCTALIVDRLLAGEFRPWALVGAFGDNLDDVAIPMARSLGLGSGEIDGLRETGRLLNYNGYGASLDDLLVHPAELFTEVRPFADPLAFHRDAPVLQKLRLGYADDMAQAAQLKPWRVTASGRVVLLPGAAWARRVMGVMANQLAREQHESAHALVTPNPDGSLMVSVRAPLATRTGADALCLQFPTGGGRAAAAGINRLPEQELESFAAAFAAHFARNSTTR